VPRRVPKRRIVACWSERLIRYLADVTRNPRLDDLDLSPDGQEVYFHKNSVVDADFYKLEIGEGAKRAQASAVIPIGKHHIVE